jgi:hypothetical protein
MNMKIIIALITIAMLCGLVPGWTPVAARLIMRVPSAVRRRAPQVILAISVRRRQPIVMTKEWLMRFMMPGGALRVSLLRSFVGGARGPAR